MNNESIGNPNSEVLFIVDKIVENQLTNTSICNYQLFHNFVTYRQTNKNVLYKNDFYLTETDKLKIHEIDSFNFKLIIVESKQIANQLNIFYKAQDCKGYEYDSDKYSIFKNYEKRKIIIHINNFNRLSKEQVFELVGDIRFISINYSIENNHTNYFDENGVFGNKQLIYYQYTCANCNTFNLKIINKSEPKPNKCKYCNESILDLEEKLKTEILILENSKLRTVTDKL